MAKDVGDSNGEIVSSGDSGEVGEASRGYRKKIPAANYRIQATNCKIRRLPYLGGDFGKAVHLVQIFGARAQDEFINAHVGLALDRVLDSGG